MYISKRNNHKNKGFTLMELIVVVAGLAILSSLSIPNILGRIKLNRVEEAKALMNSFALDCLGKYRISTNPAVFIDNATPDKLDSEKLSTLQYKIDGDKNKCAHVAITPLNENEKDLFAFDFRMSSDGRILKTGIPSDNPQFLNSCKNWAGKNCGLSDAQVAEFERLAALDKAEKTCDADLSTWLSAGNSGETQGWDSEKQDCVKPVFAYKGKRVNSLEAMREAEKAEMGAECFNWKENLRLSNHISPNGAPETIDACDGEQWWFHSGQDPFTSQIAWNKFDDEAKIQACNTNRENARLGGQEGEYVHVPDGPSPCGTVTYLCDKKEYPTLEAYKGTSCGAPPKVSGPPKIPPHCINFKPNRWWCSRYVVGQSKYNPKCECR